MCVHACMRCVQLYYSCRDSAVQLCSYGRTFDTCSSSSSCEGRCGCRLGALHCVVGWAHAAGSHCLACCERAPRALQPLHRPATRGLSSAAPVHPSRGSVRRGAPPLPPRDARGCRCRRPPRVTGGALLAVSRARNVFLERRRVSPCPTHTLCPCSVCGDGRSTAGTPPPRRVLWLLTLDAVMQGDVGLLG
jgi:hypothetical protein